MQDSLPQFFSDPHDEIPSPCKKEQTRFLNFETVAAAAAADLAAAVAVDAAVAAVVDAVAAAALEVLL